MYDEPDGDEIPPPFAKTGRPNAPSTKYAKSVSPANCQPYAAPIRKTTNVCIVIGTGQKGTCIFEEIVNKIVPKIIKKIFFTKVANPFVGKIRFIKIKLLCIE